MRVALWLSTHEKRGIYSPTKQNGNKLLALLKQMPPSLKTKKITVNSTITLKIIFSLDRRCPTFRLKIMVEPSTKTLNGAVR